MPSFLGSIGPFFLAALSNDFVVAHYLLPTIEIDQEQIDVLRKKIDVVIITATEVELRAVMHLVEPYPRRKTILLAYVGPETYYLGKLGAYKAVVTKCRMGAIGEGSVTLATNQALNVWRPKAIIMIGVAFGKDPTRQKVGDVLVASQIIPYEQMRVGEQVVFRSPIPPSNAALLNRFENALTWHFARPDGKDCDRLVGPILSGEKLVDNPVFKLHLFQQFPQAIGGEMEGAGLCAASGRVGIAWILVKSICDWGDGNKHKQHQPLAAAAAASLVHHVLSKRNTLNSIENGNFL
jgi:nucleoside phosphorylase